MTIRYHRCGKHLGTEQVSIHYLCQWWPILPADIRHYNGVTMSMMASRITSLTIVYSSVYSGKDQRNHQSSASLAFVRGIHQWPVNFPHKGPVTRKMFSFDAVIMRVCVCDIWLINLRCMVCISLINSQFNQYNVSSAISSFPIYLSWTDNNLATNYNLISISYAIISCID